jgi:hypothetical protein
MTTVKELIEHLGQFRPELRVVYQCCSEPTDLDLEDVHFLPGTVSKLIRLTRGPDGEGDYVTFDERYMKPGYVPEFIDAVYFPGN